jgi:hypothetical protein
MENTEDCHHKWILPRYAELQHRNEGMITGRCLHCNCRRTVTLNEWIDDLLVLMQHHSVGVPTCTRISVLDTYAQQLSKKHLRTVFSKFSPRNMT